MPEGPEIRVFSDSLQTYVGQYIISSTVNLPSPCYIKKIYTVGKKLIWELWDMSNINSDSNPDTKANIIYLFCSSSMTGLWSNHRRDHTRQIFIIANIRPKFRILRYLYFVDSRNIGSIEVIRDKNILDKYLSKVGIDLLQVALDKAKDTFRIQYIESLKKSGANICRFILDQETYAGCGNYIKSDALYTAGISPYRKANTLTNDESNRLYDSIMRIIKKSYIDGGASLFIYRGLQGQLGGYKCLVYGKKMDEFGNEIKHEEIGGRATYWVPKYQN